MRLLPQSVRFDADYLRRLRDGDAETARHFSDYFGSLLTLKLANGARSREMLQDVRQETLLRVLEAVRSETITQPASLGAFVCATANYVLWEQRRALGRYQQEDENAPEPPDEHGGAEEELVNEDLKRLVLGVLGELLPQDREVLRLVFLEERSKTDACGELGITPDYLRVVLHRAKTRFRKKLAAFEEKSLGA